MTVVPAKRLVLVGALTVSLVGCRSTGTLSNADLAAKVSASYGPDRQHSGLVACYTPRDAATYNRVCYDPLSPSVKLYVRVTGSTWCVLWPRHRGPLCSK